jgi:hypothetical protein
VTLAEFQSLIRTTFGAKDSRRGIDGTFMWFMEEVGDLAAALRGGHAHEELAAELADVIAAHQGRVTDTFDDGHRLFTRSVVPQIEAVRLGGQL